MPGRADRRFLLAALALSLLCVGWVTAQETHSVKTRDYERPDAETIATVTHELATDPEFLPRKTFMQWLAEKLGRWRGPDIDLPEGIGSFIFWAFVIWCFGALIAIGAHLIWTICLAVRPTRTRLDAIDTLRALEEITSPEQLWTRSHELAGAGQFREAMGALLLALLRQLERRNVVRFHRSKTNGEYLAEYRRDLAGHSEFRAFVATFECSIYGGRPVARQTYETMTTAAERIIHDVSGQTQV